MPLWNASGFADHYSNLYKSNQKNWKDTCHDLSCKTRLSSQRYQRCIQHTDAYQCIVYSHTVLPSVQGFGVYRTLGCDALGCMVGDLAQPRHGSRQECTRCHQAAMLRGVRRVQESPTFEAKKPNKNQAKQINLLCFIYLHFRLHFRSHTLFPLLQSNSICEHVY